MTIYTSCLIKYSCSFLCGCDTIVIIGLEFKKYIMGCFRQHAQLIGSSSCA